MSLTIGGHHIKYGNLSADLHGGHCCGRFHVSDFPYLTPEQKAHPEAAAKQKAFVEVALEEGAEVLWDEYGPCDDETGEREPFDMDACSYCAEVVLIETQRVNWEQVLLDLGFTMVQKFRNSNSDNWCYVYLATVGGKYA